MNYQDDFSPGGGGRGGGGGVEGEGKVLPYLSYIGMCGPQRVWFLSRFSLDSVLLRSLITLQQSQYENWYPQRQVWILEARPVSRKSRKLFGPETATRLF